MGGREAGRQILAAAGDRLLGLKTRYILCLYFLWLFQTVSKDENSVGNIWTIADGLEECVVNGEI